MKINLKNLGIIRESENFTHVIVFKDSSFPIYKYQFYSFHEGLFIKNLDLKKDDRLKITAFGNYSMHGTTIDLYHEKYDEEFSLSISEEDNESFEFISQHDINRIKFIKEIR